MALYAHTGLSCRDPAATEQFYTRYFGFHRARVVDLGGGKEIVFLKNENTHLELFKGEGQDPAGVPKDDGNQFPGVRHLAFEVTDVETFAKTLGSDLKVNLGPLHFDSFTPGWAALWIRDPDDRVVEVCQGYRDDGGAAVVAPEISPSGNGDRAREAVAAPARESRAGLVAAPNRLVFTFSDLVAGYVVSPLDDKEMFTLRTSDGRRFEIKLGANLYAQMTRNLGEPWQDCTGLIRSMLVAGRFLYAYGVFYPEDDGTKFEAKEIKFVGRTPNDFVFEKPSWWVHQIGELGEFYLNAQFGGRDTIDYRNYRTILTLGGTKTVDHRQETDTMSRLVYGFASAFHLTGREEFLAAAEKGVHYLREHMRFYDRDENIVYWYHGIDLKGGEEHKVFASEFGDDYYAVPAYEQIYALAGPAQAYRMTGDKAILKDAEMTVDLFKRFYRDNTLGGYFSHIDPVTLDPRAESLGRNRARKNWNSVGDHAPAYLINLVLATGRKDFADFLVETGDTIAERFPDYDHSPFVQEKFFEDWSRDQTWGWQQNRAVVGHNLKIAWNLMRINSLAPKERYVALARKIADIMPFCGADRQRGGWYDVVERVLGPGERFHRYAWHDRKAWWQQEQAILAYLILHGCVGEAEYLRQAREASAFYNAYFLDHQDGAVYFNVLANGIPFLVGTERLKGSHSMSGYHSFELAFLAATYTNLLIRKVPMDYYFMPYPGHLPDNKLRVAPDLLPKGSIRISEVAANGKNWTAYDPDALTVDVPPDGERIKFKVTLEPARI